MSQGVLTLLTWGTLGVTEEYTSRRRRTGPGMVGYPVGMFEVYPLKIRLYIRLGCLKRRGLKQIGNAAVKLWEGGH